MLTDLERDLLDFERLWWKHDGSKDYAIRELFDLSQTRYWQQLNVLVDRADAAVYAPEVVRRLRAKRGR